MLADDLSSMASDQTLFWMSSRLSKEHQNSIIVNNEELLERITINPKIMVGKPVIRGTRLTVEYILGLLAHGISMEAILEEYPGLAKDDIYACLFFASKSLEDASFVPLGAEVV